MLEVSENWDGIPEHERKYNRHVQVQQWRKRRQRTSQRLLKPQKLWIPLHVPSRPPFIGRRRDFYIPKTPSNSKNILSVNMYMNVFYISYIYKPATSSHTKPGLFEMSSLTLLLTDSWISPFRKSSCAVTSELDLQQIPEFRRLPISWFCRFLTSGLHEFVTLKLRRFEIPDLREFATSKLRKFEIPNLRTFATSELRRFKILDLRESATSKLRRFKIPDLRKFDVPQNSFHEFHKPRRFEGDRFSWIPQQEANS
jgi:hypothetical protein